MADDLGFTFEVKESGELAMYHHGQFATKFSAHKAISILERLSAMDFNGQQQLMARLTGNYKHGNEKLAKNHPRNR